MNRREFLTSLTASCALGLRAPQLYAATSTAAGGPMPKRILGKTGVPVSALALGGVIGMQLPPSATHDPAALAEAALDLGITYFDTAPAYNNG